eukprot:GHVT01063637.1.p1 GENE.GHVT01063637.1~~GHVT01063637.1.p1  ORF type:complete len:259 (+),score=63.02 GHVT01063637.1:291-1067(+)
MCSNASSDVTARSFVVNNYQIPAAKEVSFELKNGPAKNNSKLASERSRSADENASPPVRVSNRNVSRQAASTKNKSTYYERKRVCHPLVIYVGVPISAVACSAIAVSAFAYFLDFILDTFSSRGAPPPSSSAGAVAGPPNDAPTQAAQPPSPPSPPLSPLSPSPPSPGASPSGTESERSPPTNNLFLKPIAARDALPKEVQAHTSSNGHGNDNDNGFSNANGNGHDDGGGGDRADSQVKKAAIRERPGRRNPVSSGSG